MSAGGVVAILDACVLYPPDLRDLLLNLAEPEFYQPRWTLEILFEREHALRKRRPDLTEVQIRTVTIEMNRAFPYSLIEADRTRLEHTGLPDVNDRESS